MNLYILTEITKRELDSNLLLACIAANNNFEVMISNSDTINYLNKKNLLKPGVFHTKSLVHGEKKKELHNQLKKNEIKITSLDEEAGLVYKDLKIYGETRYSNEAINVVDKIFCWGDHDYNFLTSMFEIKDDKFVLSGSPRFDLLNNNFFSYWASNENMEKDILISGNFNLVNGYVPTSKILSEMENQGYFLRSKNYETELKKIIEDSRKKFSSFLEAIHLLVNKFKNEKFLIRPHPLEKMDIWKENFIKYPNVKISRDDNINNKLINSKMLIHNSCTTAFQAYSLKIPAICFSPIETKSNYGEPANSISEETKNIEELFNLINKILNKNYKISNLENKNKIFQNKIFKKDHELAGDIIVGNWLKLIKGIKFENINWKEVKYELTKKYFRTFLFNLIFKILKPFKKVYQDNKFEKINDIVISKKIKKILEILNLEKNIKIKKLSNRCFLIKKI